MSFFFSKLTIYSRIQCPPSLLPSAENSFGSLVGYSPCSSAHDCLATSGNHTYANPRVTTLPQNHAFAPLVDPSPSQLAENTFRAGAAHNAGIALPNGPGHCNWAPAVAAGPMDQYANTYSQNLDPSFSMMGPYAASIMGNSHGGQLQANGFSTNTSAAGAFSKASYAVDNGNSYGDQYAACGFPTQLMAPGANSSAFCAINSSNVYGGQFPADGFDTQLMAHPSVFRPIDSGNVYGGQFPASDSASGSQIQPSAAFELPNAPRAVDGNATHLGPAQAASAVHTCLECNRAFERKGDLKRHAKIHQPDSKNFRCVAAGCEYSSYRKDRLDDHVKRLHTVTASTST